MSEKQFTSMSKRRFEELRQGILDDAIAERWKKLIGVDVSDLPRKTRVEMRQVNYLLALAENDKDTLQKLIQIDWKRICIFIRDDGICRTEIHLRG